MKKYNNLNDLLVDTNIMYQIRADGVDYLSRGIYRKMDKVIKKDFKQSYKVYKKIDKIRNKTYNNQVSVEKKSKHPSLFTRFFAFSKKKDKCSSENKEKNEKVEEK